MERATSASSIRARSERVLSDIASTPVPSLPVRICRISGHFENNAAKDVMDSCERADSVFSFERKRKIAKPPGAGYLVQREYYESTLLALQSVSPINRFEFYANCIHDRNYGSGFEYKSRQHGAELVDR